MTSRPVPIEWPRPFAHTDHEFQGPRRKDPCPCGSGRQTRRCHSDRSDGRWLWPSATPLLAGDRTGYGHSKCYAAASNDCSEKISREHWLSADILRSITAGKTITVLGMPWQKGATHQLPVSALAANILCQRHNSALSPLDVTASSAFRVLWHFQEDQRRSPDPHGAEFALLNGGDLERWLLKLLWGAVAARALSYEGQPVQALRSSADADLLDYLFRDGSLPEGWGLYMAGQPDRLFSGEGQIAIRPLAHQGELWSAGVEAGAVGLRFAFGAPDGDGPYVVRRPMQIELARADAPERKILALAWKGRFGPPVTQTRIGDGTTTAYPTN
ncbi:YecA family protein [Streptomyces sp. 039-1]|uniref:YecA family protein n=1 Tax=Streptomyces sp. 039-1 TaxID=2789263 RepID=UPI0039F6034C